MVMVGLSAVPVVIVFVEWLITHKICISKYVIDMNVITTVVLAGRIPVFSNSLYCKGDHVFPRFRDLLMEISVVALNNIYWP